MFIHVRPFQGKVDVGRYVKASDLDLESVACLDNMTRIASLGMDLTPQRGLRPIAPPSPA
jgi:hypothetical protein